MTYRIYTLILFSAFLVSCESESPTPQSSPSPEQVELIEENPEEAVVQTDENMAVVSELNEKMNAAMIKGNETFPFFVENWQEIESKSATIKFAMETSTGGFEHIWFTPVTIDGDKITATCSNEPKNIPGLQLGDERVLDASLVSDWMILSPPKCYGAYTIRVMMDANPEMKSTFPHEFVDPEI